MKQATFAKIHNQVKQDFDIVESGESVNDKAIAGIATATDDLPSWKRRKAQPLTIAGVSISALILQNREAGLQ